MKIKKVTYWIVTVFLVLMMTFSAVMYLLNTQQVGEEFELLGYPTYLVNYLGLAKFLAAIVLLHNQYKKLVEWAYAGLFFDFTLALTAHLVEASGEAAAALLAIILLMSSYFLKDQVRT